MTIDDRQAGRPLSKQSNRLCGFFKLNQRHSDYTQRMALRLFAATTSQGKLRDFRTAAAAHALVFEPLPALKSIPAPEEDGATFAANATLKAVYYSGFAPGALVVAGGALQFVRFVRGTGRFVSAMADVW